MPEPVELLVRGGKRRRMPMSEPDDGDARRRGRGSACRRRGQPRAVAVDERDVGARVRREHRRCASASVMRPPRVRPISARTPRLRRGDRGAQLRDDPALEAAGLGSLPASGVDPGRRSPPRTPGTSVTKRIRSASSPTASAAAISSALTFSGPRRAARRPGSARRRARARPPAARHGSGSPTCRASATAARAGRSRRRPGRQREAPIAAQSCAFTSSSARGRPRARRRS